MENNKEAIALQVNKAFESQNKRDLEKYLKVDVIKKYICSEASDHEIGLFLGIAKSYQLNPFKREIHLIKFRGSPAQVIVGYETYLKRAERTGKWSGMKLWTEPAEEKYPTKAIVEIYRKDWQQPFRHEVLWSEYARYTNAGKLMALWETKPHSMLKKVVSSQGFRMAFPDEMGGLPYIPEELADAQIVPNGTGSMKPDVKEPEAIEQPINDQEPVQAPENGIGGDLITEKQIKMLLALCNKKHVTIDNVAKDFGIKDIKLMKKADVNKAIKMIEELE